MDAIAVSRTNTHEYEESQFPIQITAIADA